MNRLTEIYQKQALPKMSEEFGIKNSMALPKITKVVVNMGVGAAAKNKEELQQYQKDLAIITGQQPSVRNAKASVASFSLRQGMPVGLKTTLRKERMYSFLDRLMSVVLPRLRDFRGVSAGSFDKNGNYTLGIEQHIVFPEIDAVKSKPHGLEITIVTNTNETEKAKRLLELLGFPFEKEE
jgi:large subunit ribosomal protein L5